MTLKLSDLRIGITQSVKRLAMGWTTGIHRGFPQALQKILELFFKIGHGHFCLSLLKFITNNRTSIRRYMTYAVGKA